MKRIIFKTGEQRVQNLVELECGHRVRSDSPLGHRAHCNHCHEARA